MQRQKPFGWKPGVCSGFLFLPGCSYFLHYVPVPRQACGNSRSFTRQLWRSLPSSFLAQSKPPRLAQLMLCSLSSLRWLTLLRVAGWRGKVCVEIYFMKQGRSIFEGLPLRDGIYWEEAEYYPFG